MAFTASRMLTVRVLSPRRGSGISDSINSHTAPKIKNVKRVLFCTGKIYYDLLAYQQENFEKLGAKLIVVSTDILEQHKSWKAALEELSFKDRDPVEIKFPIVADNSLEVSKEYGMIHSKINLKENINAG